MISADRLERYALLPAAKQERAVAKAESREAIATHLQSARERIIQTIKSQEVFTPENGWFQISDEELDALWRYLKLTRNRLSRVGNPHVFRELNANRSFFKHLQVMNTYIDTLCDIPQFAAFLNANGITKNFLHALVMMHDYGRFIFNGPFPLLYVDGVSDGILKANFPTFPRNFMHSIKWITNSETAPDLEDGQHKLIYKLSLNEQIGLLLKTIDTLGKYGTDGHVLKIEEFFAVGGKYQQWIAIQKTNRRLPFYTDGHTLIQADTYAENDERLTRSGADVITQLTGVPFQDITQSVSDRLNLN